jgi:hypothetical protein
VLVQVVSRDCQRRILYAPVYFIVFNTLARSIFLNLYLAALLENLSQVVGKQQRLLESDFRRFEKVRARRVLWGTERVGVVVDLVFFFMHLPVLCCAVLCCAVLCCAVLCCAVLCCAVLCCAVRLTLASLICTADLAAI